MEFHGQPLVLGGALICGLSCAALADTASTTDLAGQIEALKTQVAAQEALSAQQQAVGARQQAQIATSRCSTRSACRKSRT